MLPTRNHSFAHTKRFMGSGLSCNHRSSISLPQQPASPAPARVIAADGLLREFPASSPVSVSDVLRGNADRFFVCNSDALYFDVDVPALDGGELLRQGQIYFVLPAAMLGQPLSSVEMAALAVRASEGLAARARPRGRARGGVKKVRLLPVHAESGFGDGDGEVNEKLNERTLGESAMTSPSPAKIAKKLALAARPPLRRALSTIEEDAAL